MKLLEYNKCSKLVPIIINYWWDIKRDWEKSCVLHWLAYTAPPHPTHDVGSPMNVSVFTIRAFADEILRVVPNELCLVTFLKGKIRMKR